MEQQPDLTMLEQQQIDPEVFRRVWARVMPDEKNSLIAVTPPDAAPAPAVEEKRLAIPEERAPSLTGKEETETLRRLMDLVQEGIGASQGLVRRAGGHARTLSGLLSDHQRALRQLAACYFLAAGSRYRPAGTVPVRSGSLAQALREQYLWERKWSRLCLEAAEGLEDPAVQELCQELAQDGGLHCRAIRAMLERM